MNIIVKTKAGSHLFGTNTPNSDKDYKGIYLPSLEDCITGNVTHSIRQSTNTKVGIRNSNNDIDTEIYSIQKFFKLLEEGQTIGYELLFCPDEFIIETSSMWDLIIKNRDKLVHKSIKAFIGYARQQADKYGAIGSRMNELEKMIVLLDKLDSKTTIKNNKDEIIFSMPTNYCKFESTQSTNGIIYEYLTVLGKKFDIRTTINDIKTRLIDIDREYGVRAKEAKQNKGIDWKAISHACRCCYQGIELLTTGKITFPLKQKEELLEIKKGMKTFKEIDEKLVILFDQLNNAYHRSSLPEKIDTKPLLLELYGNIYNI